jgi:hypothetical protein
MNMEPSKDAHLISRQISADFPILRKLYGVSSKFSHHLVVSWSHGVWCVHEEITDGNIASTLLTVYNTWKELAEAELAGNEWEII